MFKRTFKRTAILVVVTLGIGLFDSGLVEAQELRESPLAGQPAVRTRHLLRKNRFEVAPLIGFTMLGEFSTSVMPGAKIAFHFNDWIGIQAYGLYGIPIESGLTGLIEETYRKDAKATSGKCSGNMFLNCLPVTDPSSAQAGSMNPADFKKRLAKVNAMAGGGVELSPFFGKMALFGRLFFQYDLYFFGGVGIVSYANDWKSLGAGDTDPKNSGIKIGPTFGAGIHLFTNDWFALNFEFRDTIVRNNVSGGDNNGDFKINDKDANVRGAYIVTIGASFYLPPSISLSP